MPDIDITDLRPELPIREVEAGGLGKDGWVIVKQKDGKATARIEGGQGNLWLGGNGTDGDVILFRTEGDGKTLDQAVIRLNGQDGNIKAGGMGCDGDLLLFPSSATAINDGSQATIHLDSQDGNIKAGGQGCDGDLMLFRKEAAGKTHGDASIHLDGQDGNIKAGGNGADGDLMLFRKEAAGKTHVDASIRLDGQDGNIWAGGKGCDGDIVLFPASATKINDATQASIHLNAGSGDIKLRGSDCAENFDVGENEPVEPGTVLVVGNEGELRQSSVPYDHRVAGVVSGGGDYVPGILLGNGPSKRQRAAVALVGKTFCKVCAQDGAIQIGDLLTTSSMAGHAMKAKDPARAFGAVIGKALGALEEGTGSIPILVALQ